MDWFFQKFSTRICKYLLQRYLGQFFEEKLTLNQLSVDVFNGQGTVEKVSLDVQALNELGEKQNWPLEFVNGYIGRLTVKVPWSSLLQDSTFVEVHGLTLTLQPKQRQECATSMFESMWSSMSNSMQIAQDCIQQEDLNKLEHAPPLEGIETFAQHIESILSRVRVKFVNVVLQIEHVPKNSTTGIGIVINIDNIEYSDEAGNDPSADQIPETTKEQKKSYMPSSFVTKKLIFEGVSFSTVEFPSSLRTFSRSTLSQSQSTEKEDQNIDESTEVSPDLEDDQRNVILCGRLCNRQEIRIRSKQSEAVTGPKMFFEVNLGALMVFLSPRQMHLLLELAAGLATPDNDTSNLASKHKYKEKPMSELDYQRIEQQLQQQLSPLATIQLPGLRGAQTWSSTAGLEDDDQFLPMRPQRSGLMSDSTTSAASSSMESSLTSSIMSSASDATFRSRRRITNIESDPTAEISHFQIGLTSLAVLILHEDVLSVDGEHCVVSSSVKQMRNLAQHFFDRINSPEFLASLMKDFEESKTIFAEACPKSHLRLLASRLNVEADETTTSSAFSITGKLTVSKMELLECLLENNTMEYFPLLTFTDYQNLTKNPSLKLSFRHIEKTGKSGSKRASKPKTEISITLDTCTIELDITIVDRIYDLLNPQPICVIAKPPANVWGQPNPISPATSQGESHIDVKLHCSCLSVRLRFPITDLRPSHDPNRAPWWKRQVRSEFLLLKLHHANAETVFETNQPISKYSIQCHELDVFYYESARSEPIVIAKATSTSKNRSENCELTVTVFPVKEKQDAEPPVQREIDMTQSIYGSFEDEFGSDMGPFSSERLIHASHTAHSRDTDDSDALIMPGNRNEMDKFIRTTTDDSRIQIQAYFSTLSLQIVSKHTYEVIYNRINNDLLLWEPSAPKSKVPTYDKLIPSTSTGQEPDENFSEVKSGVQYESDSEADDDDMETEASSLFYSTHDGRSKHKTQTAPIKVTTQSYLTFNMYIGKGLLNLYPLVRDSARNAIPGQTGEFLLSITNAHLFVVSGYCGDDDLGFVCVQAHDGHLHHCDMMTTPSQSPPLKEIGTAVGKHLHSTISKSEPGVLVDAQDRGGNRTMISVAIRIQAKHETQHVKTIRVAVGLNKATLHHKICSEPNSWISHFCDFFDVKDYPIPGYVAKNVITELHVHLWDCAIDYRPLYIPLRSVITIGNFSLSAHLSAQANSSTLYFTAEECGLFLSDKASLKHGAAVLKRDYIRVIDLGLFEFSLKTNKESKNSPHIDLRMSNNMLHIRTCADSARALMQFIAYFVSDGDLQTPSDASSSVGSVHNSPMRRMNEPQLVDVEPQEISKLTKSQEQRVHDLLGDAMQESVSPEQITTAAPTHDTDVYYFPDENVPYQDSAAALPQVTTELGDVANTSNKSNDTDDEYFFVEPALALPTYTDPEIRWLTSESLRIVDKYFTIPSSRTDALKPPRNFPTPVQRYTLCEMTIVWHMYGGSDFKSGEKEKKSVNFADLKTGGGVRYSSANTGTVSFAQQKRKSNRTWQEAGGPHRDHDVLMELQLNKVRFQHETYPEHTTQASRQVLVVSEFEIRDRHTKSQINKFLYHYISQMRPRQSHANMLSIKALHIRPDRKLKRQECCLRISLLPLCLVIDQDAVSFLVQFFKECGDEDSTAGNVPSKHSTPTHQLPVMTVSVLDKTQLTEQVQDAMDEESMLIPEESEEATADEASNTSQQTREDESQPIYFRSIIFYPSVPIKLDYLGKRVDMAHGPFRGILLGLTQLNSSELHLKRLSKRDGILGVEKLISYCLNQWKNDIMHNQFSKLLKGVGPVKAVSQLIQGIIDLFWMPFQQYQKDGRIIKGFQKGANSFTTSTAMAALELTSRIIHLLQVTAETAYDMLSPGPSIKRSSKGKGRKKRYSQPQDIREGMANAYQLVREGIGETADNIVRVASHEHEQKGYSGAVGGVLRQIPPTLVKPIIIASEATNNVLGGVRSQLVPDARREASQKWRSDDG